MTSKKKEVSTPSSPHQVQKEWSNISSKGLFNLKAELLRTESLIKAKRHQETEQNQTSLSSEKIVTKKLDKTKFVHPHSSESTTTEVKRKRKKKKDQSNTDDPANHVSKANESQLSQEEWNLLQASLMQKQALYETLCQTGANYDDYLVDFGSKPLPEHAPLPLVPSEQMESEDPFMEVEDEFGRTRQMRMSEYQQLQREKEKERAKSGFYPASSTYVPSKPIHFDASQEVRTLGVSFYQFSQHEEERAQQMEQLRQLRLETVQNRSQYQEKEESKEDERSGKQNQRYTDIEQRKQLILQKRAQKLGEKNCEHVLWLSDF